MKEGSRRLLPPMAMLHSFAAAARTGSFSRAGLEVGLTQGAISRQVAALEAWLGQPLFDRRGRRVALNPAGRRYADAVETALSGLRQATRFAVEQPADQTVELATLPSFGMRWLAPRLPRLSALHPELVVNFSARSDEFSFADEQFDAAIHFGVPDWPGVRHDLLFHETAVPVAAPALAARVAVPEDVLRLPLLTLTSRRDAWPRWLAEQGIDRVRPAASASFGQFLMMAQAAAAGGGAALIPSFLIEPELRSGALVLLGPASLPTSAGYYLVYPPNATDRPAMRHLIAWIRAERAVDDSSSPN